ncbi:hypothetical protein HRF87_11420 [Bacillus sp. CRN 9]|nr:hypothetical protein [Bacillus sp. CRN 9]
MEVSQWLNGGPFLEVSFLMKFNGQRKKTIRDILNKLSKVNKTIEIVDHDIDGSIDSFESGYLFDEGVYHHSLRLDLYVYLARRRKAILQVEIVSSNAIMVDFWFYGSSFDAPEWNQVGIKKDEMIDFTHFLVELYLIYEFKVGGIAVEHDILELFRCNETYPNEGYRYENASLDFRLLEPSNFIHIIWNETYKKLNNIPFKIKRVDKEGILILNDDCK